MSFLDRFLIIISANLNSTKERFFPPPPNPEREMEEIIRNMEEDLVQLRQIVARRITNKNQIERRAKNSLAEANKWEENAKVARGKGDESAVSHALHLQQCRLDEFEIHQQVLTDYLPLVDRYRKQLIDLENQISMFKTRKNDLQTRLELIEFRQKLKSVDIQKYLSKFEQEVIEQENRIKSKLASIKQNENQVELTVEELEKLIHDCRLQMKNQLDIANSLKRNIMTLEKIKSQMEAFPEPTENEAVEKIEEIDEFYDLWE